MRTSTRVEGADGCRHNGPAGPIEAGAGNLTANGIGLAFSGDVPAGRNARRISVIPRAGRSLVGGLALLALVGGCVVASKPIPQVEIPVRSTLAATGFGRVLVAGFLPEGSDQIDLNRETARFLRMQLRSGSSLEVIESEPLLLTASFEDSNSAFANATFWKRLGEEYSDPLIVTGTVWFRPAVPRTDERTVGQRSIRLWRRGFSLRLRLVLISGKTGEVIDSVSLRQLTAHATTGREGALSIYLRLMDESMPSILGALGEGVGALRVLLR